MVGCFAPGCEHNSTVQDCHFTRFPGDEVLRKKWIDLIRRGDKEPTSTSRLCSCHFDRDHLPKIFERNKIGISLHKSPEKKKRKRTVTQEKRRNTAPCEDPINEGTSATVEETSAPIVDTVAHTGTFIEDTNFEVTRTISKETRWKEEMVALKVSCEHKLAGCKKEIIDLKKSYERELADCKKEIIDLKKSYERELTDCKLEIMDLKKRNESLMDRMFEFKVITKNHDLCVHYTGLSPQVMFILLETLENISLKKKFTNVLIVTLQNQLLLTLMKLRRNLSHHDLAFRFGVSYSTVQTVFHTIVQVLHEVLFLHFMDKIPSREKNRMFLPECFKPYPHVRINLDCTEIKCDTPGSMDKQKAVFSNYKASTTLKFLVGCSVNGAVTFCSPSYPGSTSDKAIVEHTGILSQLVPGDMILADKGFLVADVLPPGVSLNIPPFLDLPQFTEDEVFRSRQISRGRVHIERINIRLKRFLILRYIPQHLVSSIDRIVQLCCALVNLQNPIMSECKNFFSSLHNTVSA